MALYELFNQDGPPPHAQGKIQAPYACACCARPPHLMGSDYFASGVAHITPSLHLI